MLVVKESLFPSLLWLKIKNIFSQAQFWVENFSLARFWLKEVDFWLDWLESQIPKLLDFTRLDSQWLGWLVTQAISDLTRSLSMQSLAYSSILPVFFTVVYYHLLSYWSVLSIRYCAKNSNKMCSHKTRYICIIIINNFSDIDISSSSIHQKVKSTKYYT